jgi:protein-tyrosine-phosphatase
MNNFTIHDENQMRNTIRFFNTLDGQRTEVLRISSEGVTANPDIPTDEAADAVLRALDTYLKNMVAVAIKQERNRLADELQKMPLNDTANSIAYWIRDQK